MSPAPGAVAHLKSWIQTQPRPVSCHSPRHRRRTSATLACMPRPFTCRSRNRSCRRCPFELSRLNPAGGFRHQADGGFPLHQDGLGDSQEQAPEPPGQPCASAVLSVLQRHVYRRSVADLSDFGSYECSLIHLACRPPPSGRVHMSSQASGEFDLLTEVGWTLNPKP